MHRSADIVIAHHEAGHVVMAMACGLTISKMTVEVTPSSMGQVVFQAPDPLTNLSRQQSVLTFVSGMTADFIHWSKWGKGTENDIPSGYTNDRQMAMQHLISLGEGDLLDAYTLKSKLFLERADVWPLVELVAQHLLHIESVDRKAFMAGIAEQCPKFSDEDWAHLEIIKDALRTRQDDLRVLITRAT